MLIVPTGGVFITDACFFNTAVFIPHSLLFFFKTPYIFSRFKKVFMFMECISGVLVEANGLCTVRGQQRLLHTCLSSPSSCFGSASGFPQIFFSSVFDLKKTLKRSVHHPCYWVSCIYSSQWKERKLITIQFRDSPPPHPHHHQWNACSALP